jgi:hypothetical protein
MKFEKAQFTNNGVRDPDPELDPVENFRILLRILQTGPDPTGSATLTITHTGNPLFFL